MSSQAIEGRRRFLKAMLVFPLIGLDGPIPSQKHTDFQYADMQCPWAPYVWAYCNGKQVKYARVADAVGGWVQYVDLDDPNYLENRRLEPPKKYITGRVQILFKSPQDKYKYHKIRN